MKKILLLCAITFNIGCVRQGINRHNMIYDSTVFVLAVHGLKPCIKTLVPSVIPSDSMTSKIISDEDIYMVAACGALSFGNQVIHHDIAKKKALKNSCTSMVIVYAVRKLVDGSIFVANRISSSTGGPIIDTKKHAGAIENVKKVVLFSLLTLPCLNLTG